MEEEQLEEERRQLGSRTEIVQRLSVLLWTLTDQHFGYCFTGIWKLQTCSAVKQPLSAWLQLGAHSCHIHVAMKRGKPASSSDPFDDKEVEKLDEESEESPLLPAKPPKPSFPSSFRDGFGLGCFMQRLESSFGYELLVMLFVAQHLMKGFVNEFCAPCIAYLYGSYKVTGPQMQIYRGVTQLPWAMKPMIGLLSDAVPIFGYNKSPYILLVAIFGTAAMTTIGIVPKDSLSITSLVLCLFLIQLQLSTTDLLTEAKYAEKMQSKPKEGPALMSYVWFGLQMGGLCATLLNLSCKTVHFN